MIYSIWKTKQKSVKSVNYHLNRFLTAFAWSSLSFMIISAESTADLILNVLLNSSSWKAVFKYS